MSEREAERRLDAWVYRLGQRARRRGSSGACPFEAKWAVTAWGSGFWSVRGPKGAKR